MSKEIKDILTLEIPINVLTRHNQPCIELRKLISYTSSDINKELVEQIVQAAYHKKYIIIRPIFTDTIKSIGSLMEKGILYKDEEGDYRFTI